MAEAPWDPFRDPHGTDDGLFTCIRACLPAIISYALPTNRASERVMEKQGFRYERDIVHAGLPHVFYRLTAAQWREDGAPGRPGRRDDG